MLLFFFFLKMKTHHINIYKNTPKTQHNNKNKIFPSRKKKKKNSNQIQLARCRPHRRGANGTGSLSVDRIDWLFSRFFSRCLGLNTLSLMECVSGKRERQGATDGDKQGDQSGRENGHTTLTARLNCQGAPMP
jgi:hypothetical protein